MPIISKECIHKDRKFCKFSKCFDSDAILRWRVAKEEFLFILSLLKSLMSLYLESTDTGWSESLKGVFIELHSEKMSFDFHLENVGLFRKKEIIKTRIY